MGELAKGRWDGAGNVGGGEVEELEIREGGELRRERGEVEENVGERE